MMKRAMIVGVLAACGSKGSELAGEARCREATAKLEALWSQLNPGMDFTQVRASEIEHCTKKYTNATVDCIVAATTLGAAKACYSGGGRPERPKASETELAKLQVKKVAFEAYPLWSAAHPESACPQAPNDLAKYMEKETLDDPWGHPLRLYCGANLPAGARGFAAASAGPDGAFDTPDDIKSW